VSILQYVLNLAEDGRVLSVGIYYDPESIPDGAVMVNSFPEPVTDYIYQNGEFVYSPLPKAEEERSE
jgi:hypothetical protein